jgi:hypothetical protein
MTGGQFRALREHLGLSWDDATRYLELDDSSLPRKWDASKSSVPVGVARELEQLHTLTLAVIDTLVNTAEAEPLLIVYNTDAEFHAAHPQYARLPARWWRQLAAQAARLAPALVVATPEDLRRANSRPAGTKAPPATE